jgi:hypothetical protein
VKSLPQKLTGDQLNDITRVMRSNWKNQSTIDLVPDLAMEALCWTEASVSIREALNEYEW